jgi:hypothetical protein
VGLKNIFGGRVKISVRTLKEVRITHSTGKAQVKIIRIKTVYLTAIPINFRVLRFRVRFITNMFPD